MGSTEEWKRSVVSILAEVKANQEHLHEKIDEYIEESTKRLDSLEHVVYGNGKEGLAESVRNIKGKWAAVYGLLLLVLSAVTNAAAKELLAFFK